VAVAASVMMGMTVLGRHLYAVGGNETAARLSGLPTRRLHSIAYMLSGLLAALAGIVLTGRDKGGAPPDGVGFYETLALAAALLGGCSFAGGVGSVRGAVLGAVLVVLVVVTERDLVSQWTFTSPFDGLVAGGLLVVALAFARRPRGRG
jgi:ribose/xylose/arabinose/galactoside ABC-type transport system permease subunit